ncbi:ATP-dependent nuclease [Tenacibaculum halocynthiae]|uniref:ATP-dependent nuclease n=1 Tax=Tenacibaculum halocynthiae TaxID=1254437 RepID=UPI003D65EE3E
MYLKKIEISNFRKFRTENNIIEFVDAESMQKHKKGENINIAPVTTLIVGKNNSGKTTVATALEKLIKEIKFEPNDFNFSYLKEKLQEYQKEIQNPSFNVKPPSIEFKLTVGIEDSTKDLVTNLVPFMTLAHVNTTEINIIGIYEQEEQQQFQKNVIELLDEGIVNFKLRFKKFINLLAETDYRIKYYNEAGSNVSFKIRDLIEIKPIKANNINGDRSLSRAFTKIVEYRYKSTLGQKDRKELEDKIEEINEELSLKITNKHTDSINDSLKTIESSQKLEMLLSSDLNFNTLMTNLIKYEYIERGQSIPETQFGLGYTNLMMIIADLIEYMEKYPEQSFNSKVNLISIEEPETFMHPQMQELFIKHINEAISSLLKDKNKKVNSQLIITTHSSHILNSKIHSGNTFNNINYMTTVKNSSYVVSLNDEKITPRLRRKQDDLKFLKKHIKYKVSELFFSDAIIFIEGVTEETLLRYHIDNNEKLNKYYISIFNIDGAHGLVYHELIKLLKIPTLIITDLDIKRSDREKKEFMQVNCLCCRKTTNQTIKRYYQANASLKGIPKKIEEDNFIIYYQRKINNYYATSFEEAYILTNYKNKFFQKVLKEVKRNTFLEIIGKPEDYNKLREKSYKLQIKLSSSKSDFTNTLLYNLIVAKEKEEKLLILPEYITEGLDWLIDKLKA